MNLLHRPDLSRYRAVLFDFDGTLAPCLDLRAMKQTVLDFTVRETGVDPQEIDSMMAIEFIEYAARRLDKNGAASQRFREQAHALIRDIEMSSADEIGLYDGVSDLLLQLLDRGIRTGIVTRNCEAAVRRMFPDVDRYCQALFTRDQIPHEHLKPDQRHLLACIEQLDCEAGEALMIGDGILDMRVAMELGMDRVGVLGGHNDGTDLVAAGANWIVANVRELNHCL